MSEHRPSGPANGSTPLVYIPPQAPYALARSAEAGRILFLAGQVPVDSDGRTVAIGDIDKQATQVFANIAAILSTYDAALSDIVRLMIFTASRDHLVALAEARRRTFREPYPAATIVIAGLAHPDWLLEIEATVALPVG